MQKKKFKFRNVNYLIAAEKCAKKWDGEILTPVIDREYL